MMSIVQRSIYFFLLFPLWLSGQWTTYGNNTSGAIPNTTGLCLDRTINVPDNIVVNDIMIGLRVSHSVRGEVRAFLRHPDNTEIELTDAATSTSANLNWDFNDFSLYGQLDPLVNVLHSITHPAFAFRVRPGQSLSTFIGKPAIGDWNLRVCDNTNNFNSGTFEHAQFDIYDGDNGSETAVASTCTASDYRFDWDVQSYPLGVTGTTQLYTNVDGSGVDMTVTVNDPTSSLSYLDDAASYSTSNNTGGVSGNGEQLFVGVDPPNGSGSTVTTTITFSNPVADARLSVADIDIAGPQFPTGRIDQVTITGLNGAISVAPTLVSEYARPTFSISGNTATGGPIANYTNVAQATPGSVPGDRTRGTLDVYFDAPVTEITVSYIELGTGTNPAERLIGIGDIIFCTSSPLLPTVPIEITRFEASKDGNRASLSWATSSETNNHYFSIERTTNNDDWIEIGRSEGANTSNTNKTYQYYDNTPAKGTNLYRLHQVDYDGKSSFSEVRALKFGKGYHVEAPIIYPNPTSGVVFVSEMDKVDNIEVYDQLGTLVKVEVLQNGFSMASLPTGVYTVRMIMSETDLVFTKRIIKEI